MLKEKTLQDIIGRGTSLEELYTPKQIENARQVIQQKMLYNKTMACNEKTLARYIEANPQNVFKTYHVNFGSCFILHANHDRGLIWSMTYKCLLWVDFPCFTKDGEDMGMFKVVDIYFLSECNAVQILHNYFATVQYHIECVKSSKKHYAMYKKHLQDFKDTLAGKINPYKDDFRQDDEMDINDLLLIGHIISKVYDF